jgi:hypothetical protein
LDIHVSGHELSIESQSLVKDYKDKLSYNLKLDETGAHILFTYHARQKDDDEKTQKKVSLEADLKEILEAEAPLGYEKGDAKVSSYSIGASGWRNIKYSRELDANNKTVHVFTASTNDGVFVLKGFISGDIIDSTHNHDIGLPSEISPNWLKLDFEIHDYAYQQDGTKLVMVIDALSKVDYREKYSDGVTIHVEDDDPVDAIFAWLPNCNYNNRTELDIIATMCEDPDTQKQTYYFTFDTTEKIVDLIWDPEMGIGWSVSNLGLIIALVCGFVGLVIIVAYALYRRKKSKEEGTMKSKVSRFFGRS